MSLLGTFPINIRYINHKKRYKRVIATLFNIVLMTNKHLLYSTENVLNIL